MIIQKKIVLLNEKIVLTAIARVKKGYLVAEVSNWNEANVTSSRLAIVSVKVYDPGTRYHYEVSIIDKEYGTVTYKYSYSSSKRYEPKFVARLLVTMYH